MLSYWLKLSPFWRFQLAGWLAFVLATFPLKLEMMQSLPAALFLCIVRDGSSFLLTLGLRAIYLRFWTDQIGTMAATIMAACTVGGLLQAGFFLTFHPLLPFQGEIHFTRSMEFNLLYERTGLLFGWSFLYFGMRQHTEGMRRRLRLALAESARNAAEVQLLRSQTNPHFLFNALNTIRAGVEKANAGLGKMVQSLADFLRFSLDHSNEDLIPLGRELDAMRSYLDVEKARFGDGLEFDCQIDGAARDVPVPGIILQPLVENAVKYGLDTSDTPLHVRIHISLIRAGTLRIVVANTGHWLEPSPREKTSHIGLENLRRRLALLYPDKHRLDITQADGWVTLTIEIPAL